MFSRKTPATLNIGYVDTDICNIFVNINFATICALSLSELPRVRSQHNKEAVGTLILPLRMLASILCLKLQGAAGELQTTSNLVHLCLNEE